MKLLVFSPYYPPHVGGIENYVREFSLQMAKQGHTILIFTPDLPPSHDTNIETSLLSIIRFPAFEIIPNYPFPRFWKWEFWRQLYSLSQLKPDVAISQTRFFFTSLLALIYAKATSTPYVHVEHGSGFVNVSSLTTTAISYLYDQTLGRLIFQSSDINVCISQAVSRFVSRFDKRPPHVVYRGMDFSTLDAATPDEGLRNRFPEKTLIASVARLYKWKGIDNSINAIAQLSPSEREQIVFLIIGDGEDRNRLEKLVGKEIPIVFLGNIPRERVFSILKSIDIYIHSAHLGGGLSTSLLEALYAGCAVIASPNEGANEVIEHYKNGILLEESSAKSIAHGLRLLLHDNPRLLSELRRNSKESVMERFSWTTAGHQFASLFERLKTQ